VPKLRVLSVSDLGFGILRGSAEFKAVVENFGSLCVEREFYAGFLANWNEFVFLGLASLDDV